jgi:phenylalanyl-tRNA synthetase beta chain
VLACDCGLDEVMTYSFDSQTLLGRLGHVPADPVVVSNPISSDFQTLRTGLAPNLLGAVERNAQRFPEFGLFEVGRVFAGTHVEDGTPWQRYRLGIALHRRAAKAGEDAETLLRRLRGIVEHLLDRMDVAAPRVAEGWDGDALPWLSPRATLGVSASGRRLGWMTRVHPGTLRALDVPGVAVLAELDVEEMVSAPGRVRRFEPVPRFPSSTIDLSLVAPEAVPAEALFEAIRGQGGPDLADVDLFAIYRGAPIPEGRRSLSFRLTFQASDRTLSDAEVKDAVARITEAARAAGAVVWGEQEAADR